MTKDRELSTAELALMAKGVRDMLEEQFGHERIKSFLVRDGEIANALLIETYLAVRKHLQ